MIRCGLSGTTLTRSARVNGTGGPVTTAQRDLATQRSEAEFHRAAVEQAQRQRRDGLPLRADINVVGYLARKPEGAERA